MSRSVSLSLVFVFKFNFLLQELVGVELLVALAAYPPPKACFSVVEIVVDISVVYQPLDCLYPIAFDVRPTFNLFGFLPWLRHRATDAANACITLVVETPLFL